MNGKHSVIRSDNDIADEYLIPVTGSEENEDEEELEEVSADDEEVDDSQEGSIDDEQSDEDDDETNLRASYEELKARYEKDIGAVKSALDKQVSSVKKKSEDEIAKLKQQINKLRLESMTDDQRKVYESEIQNETLQELQQKAEEAERKAAESENKTKWLGYFLDQGVEVSELDMSGNFDTFYTSGMNAITKRLKTYREQLDKMKTTPNKDKLKGKKPPKVEGLDAGTKTKPTLNDLVKKYADGDFETFMRMADTDPNIQKLLNKLE